MYKLSVVIVGFIVGLQSASAWASRPNFECDIFGGIKGTSAHGSFKLAGEEPTVQTFELSIAEEGKATRKFDGKAYLQGMKKFTDLEMEIQRDIISAIRSSRRINLTTGDLVLFTNTKSVGESTLNVFLMPSGEMAYIEIGRAPSPLYVAPRLIFGWKNYRFLRQQRHFLLRLLLPITLNADRCSPLFKSVER